MEKTRPGIAYSMPTVLIGMTGCGKSTVGKALAEALGVPFYDTDEEIVRRAGRSVGEIFRAEGEEGFRRIEAETAAELLSCPAPSVIACGGGVILREENRARLREKGFIVWLRRDPDEVLKDRAVLRRPPICGQRSNYLLLLEKRTPIYASLADITVDCGSVAETVAEIRKEFAKQSCIPRESMVE